MSAADQEVDRSTARELALHLHVSYRTVVSWAREGYSLEAVLGALGVRDGGDDQWLSIASVAARFDVNAKTVRRWISAGHVHARRFGPRLIRVALRSVLEYSDAIGAPHIAANGASKQA